MENGALCERLGWRGHHREGGEDPQDPNEATHHGDESQQLPEVVGGKGRCSLLCSGSGLPHLARGFDVCGGSPASPRTRPIDMTRVWEYGSGMVKMTFTFDRETVDRLRKAAARLARPQSYVVREAVREYAERIGNLSEQERRHLLNVFDTVIPAIPPRLPSQVRAEIAEVRAARRRGGRRHRPDTR